MPGSSRRTAAACVRAVTTSMRAREMSGVRRATVSTSMLRAPTIGRSCLGVRVRLRGQKRVPDPPAITTA